MAKINNEPFFQDQIDSDARAGFIEKCTEEKVQIKMDLIRKIQSKQVEMNDSRIDLGVCKAFSKALRQDKDMLQKLTLGNNGLNDEGFALILEGLRT